MSEIRFQRQPNPYGCNYYSVAALCDVPPGWAAEHEIDCSTERMMIRLAEHGYSLWPLYLNRSDQPVDKDWWRWLVSVHADQGPGWFDYQLAIESPTYPGVDHAVGLRLYFHDGEVSSAVVVDTSGHDAPQEFEWHDFLASCYARSFDVRLIWSNALEAWGQIDGREAAHVTGAEQ